MSLSPVTDRRELERGVYLALPARGGTLGVARLVFVRDLDCDTDNGQTVLVVEDCATEVEFRLPLEHAKTAGWKLVRRVA